MEKEHVITDEPLIDRITELEAELEAQDYSPVILHDMELMQRRISELQSQINQLRPYLHHKAGSYNSACCASLRPTLNPSVKRDSCDCGLQQALQENGDAKS